jgi:hypothetical protein
MKALSSGARLSAGTLQKGLAMTLAARVKAPSASAAGRAASR